MNTLAFCFSHFLSICIDLSEPKDNRGLVYPSGLTVFSLMLCTCAGRIGQRSKARWIYHNWPWIYAVWCAGGGRIITKNVNGISQSTISRFKSQSLLEDFSDQMNTFHKQQFMSDYQKLVSITLEKGIRRNANPMPHYCIDGKSREGCISEETGRTEVDLSLYNPETSSAIISFPLEDKQGERSGLKEILDHDMSELPQGIMTGDAGITSVNSTEDISHQGHEYLLQIKGNAGKSYEEIHDIPWEKVKDTQRFDHKGHGRMEIKHLQRFDIEFIESPVNIDKYHDIAGVFRLESWVKTKQKIAHSIRYYIGSSGIMNKPLSYIYNTIRQHWRIESYHWRKDKILGEDSSNEKESIASRIYSRINSFVDYIGSSIYGSTKELIDRFSAAPEKMAFSSGFL